MFGPADVLLRRCIAASAGFCGSSGSSTQLLRRCIAASAGFCEVSPMPSSPILFGLRLRASTTTTATTIKTKKSDPDTPIAIPTTLPSSAAVLLSAALGSEFPAVVVEPVATAPVVTGADAVPPVVAVVLAVVAVVAAIGYIGRPVAKYVYADPALTHKGESVSMPSTPVVQLSSWYAPTATTLSFTEIALTATDQPK